MKILKLSGYICNVRQFNLFLTRLRNTLNFYTRLIPSHASAQWERASTQRSRVIRAWRNGRPISERWHHSCLSYTMTRARRNGIGEKRSPSYREVCLLFSAHTNFWTPLTDIICDRWRCKTHCRNRENVRFLLILIYSYKTVSKGGKHRVHIS